MLPALPILAAVTVIALLAIGAWAILQVRLQTLLRHRGPVRRVAVPLLLSGLLLPTVGWASPAPLPLRWRSSAVVSGEVQISSGRASREAADLGENRTSGFRLFLQVDPSGYADSPNLYAGFGNDPVNNRDPTGRATPAAGAAIGAVLGGLFDALRQAAEIADSPNKSASDFDLMRTLEAAGTGAVIGAAVGTCGPCGVGLAIAGGSAGAISAKREFEKGNWRTGLVDTAGAALAVAGGRSLRASSAAADAAETQALRSAIDEGLSAAAREFAGPPGPVPLAPSPSSPNAYSVAFEMQLNAADLGKSRSVHFNRANGALDAALSEDAAYRQLMEDLIPGVSDAVSKVGGRQTPEGWIWQHATQSQAQGRSGVLHLVPESQHTPGSAFWNILHPNPGGGGGYAEWAIPAGAPKN